MQQYTTTKNITAEARAQISQVQMMGVFPLDYCGLHGGDQLSESLQR